MFTPSICAFRPNCTTPTPQNEPMGLCYTSGTTGNPKGVCYSHRSCYLHTMASNIPDALGIRGTDVLLPVVPMFHVMSWGVPFIVRLVALPLDIELASMVRAPLQHRTPCCRRYPSPSLVPWLCAELTQSGKISLRP